MAVNVNAAVGVFDNNGVDGGDHGGAVLWPADDYYLVATASATTAGNGGHLLDPLDSGRGVEP
jgi:hypothetical protein